MLAPIVVRRSCGPAYLRQSAGGVSGKYRTKVKHTHGLQLLSAALDERPCSRRVIAPTHATRPSRASSLTPSAHALESQQTPVSRRRVLRIRVVDSRLTGRSHSG